MRLIDLDQTIFIPLMDEAEGTTYEVQMTLGEFLYKFLDEFQPEVVNAIPVEWLREFDLYYAGISGGTPYMNELVEAWQKGQGRDNGRTMETL